MIHTLTAHVRMRHIYECSICGLRAVGDTETYDVTSVEGVHRLMRDLETRPGRSAYMPVGWGFYGKFRCPAHLKGEQHGKTI